MTDKKDRLKTEMLSKRDRLISKTIKENDKDIKKISSTIVDRVVGDLACRVLREVETSGFKLGEDFNDTLADFCKMAVET